VSGLALRWSSVLAGYGRTIVLHGITLDVQPGDCVALLGTNGAGKTTMARMLVGLVRPTSGSVHVGHVDVARMRPDQMAPRVGYAFQHADQQLFARTIREDVAFGPQRLGLGLEGVNAVLDELELGALADRHPYDVPPPTRKLVALAGVLAMRTPVLVLDEPTAGLDAAMRALVDLAVQRRLDQGVTVLLISHDMIFVRAVARREVVIEQGQIVADSRP
jgi:energy-coupling factor transport system ATP-binding protein